LLLAADIQRVCLGVKAVSADTRVRAEFEVPYAAGELKAIALVEGRQVAELTLASRRVRG
jgi:hypothetical protein